MPGTEQYGQRGTPFDGFLYAPVGVDRGGNTVSVLSALARLGLDPWDEAAELSDLPRDGARNRLGSLLTRFGDVPALGRDQGAIIPRLVDLLPSASGRQGGQRRTAVPQGVRAIGLGPIVAILLVVLFLAQTFMFGTNGIGN
ncbi:MAG: hypothetical protein JJU40_08915 [Rhodobacteraceae bacterium]|nr:hypothetical protein [Paracoccaceae bacterium]